MNEDLTRFMASDSPVAYQSLAHVYNYTDFLNKSIFHDSIYVRTSAVTTCLRKCKSQNQGCHHCYKVSSCQQLQSNSVKRAVLPALQPAYSYFFISHNKNSNSPPLCPKNPYIFISNHLENFLMTVRSGVFLTSKDR